EPGMPAAPHHFFPGLGLADRYGTMWRGDWISTFGWLRSAGTFADIPGGPIHHLAFDRVVPRRVLTGFQPWEHETRVHSGIIRGWAEKPAATIGERPVGKGKLTATTFRLFEDPPGTDPIATTLLDALIATGRSYPQEYPPPMCCSYAGRPIGRHAIDCGERMNIHAVQTGPVGIKTVRADLVDER